MHAVKNDGSEDLDIDGSFGTSDGRFRESGGFERNDAEQFIYSLKSYQLIDYSYYIVVHGSPYRTGSYTLTLLNPEASENESGGSVNNLSSKVIDTEIASLVSDITSGFSYTNQFGQIGTHNPEEFFTRLFRNKYEQDPSPVQIARGVGLLTDGNFTQLQFLHDVSLIHI